jgi:hypothetical protein
MRINLERETKLR